MEDIDCAFVQRKKKENSGITFSGLLNAIDGVGASEGRIVFMTTNHIEKLDPALIRPGRIDVKMYLGNATSAQCKKLFMKFFPDKEHLVEEFKIPSGKFSIAIIQDYLMLHQGQAERAIASVESIEKIQLLPKPNLPPEKLDKDPYEEKSADL